MVGTTPLMMLIYRIVPPCLDPCFGGCLVGTKNQVGFYVNGDHSYVVSILVLVDVWWVPH